MKTTANKWQPLYNQVTDNKDGTYTVWEMKRREIETKPFPEKKRRKPKTDAERSATPSPKTDSAEGPEEPPKSASAERSGEGPEGPEA